MRYIILAVVVSAIITYGLRSVVFLFFSGDKKLPEWLDKLGEVLPASIMAVLVIYCLRAFRDDFARTGIMGIVAAVCTALVHKWKHNTFLSIIVGTIVYMVLIRVW